MKILFLIMIFSLLFIPGNNIRKAQCSQSSLDRVELINSIKVEFAKIRKDFEVINYKLDSIKKQRELLTNKNTQDDKRTSTIIP